MNTKALRQKVLDLAIHGKLVPQNPNDESATVLLEKIRAEKAEKIKKGELKADKKDSFIFVGSDKRHYEKFADGSVKDIEDEIPFEVSEGWSWVRLKEIGNTNIGLTYHPVDLIKTGIPVLRSNNIKDDKLCLSDLARVQTKILDNQFVSTGDILICARNGSKNLVGKCTIISNLPEKMAFGAFMAVFRSEFNPYILRYLQSIYFKDYLEESNSTQIYQLTQNMLKEAFLPLPPLAEQKLIVEEIEKIFAQIDLLEQNKTDLQTAIKQAKSKILDLAIHGKLVPQDPNDEPASVLLEKIRAEKEEKINKGELKRDKNDSYIYKSTTDNCHYEKFADGSEEEIGVPFELQNGWIWGRIKDVYNYIGDGDWIESKDQSTSGIRLLQTGNIGFGSFKDKKDNYHYINEETFIKLNCNEIFPGDILISRLPEPVGRSCIIPEIPTRLITAVDCTILRLNNRILMDNYFIYYTQSSKYLDLIKDNCTGTTRLRISRANLEKIFLPIPPKNEQSRIVTKIKDLFSILDKISLNLV